MFSSSNINDVQHHPTVAWLDVTCRAVATGRQQARALAAAVRSVGLSGSQFELLWLLHRPVEAESTADTAPALDQQAIAEKLGLSTAQVSTLVERVRQTGQISGSRLSQDRRRQIWQITPSGTKIVRRARDVLAKSLETADPEPLDRSSGKRVAAAAVWILACVVLIGSGCTRSHYRRQADTESYQAVDQAAACGNTGAPEFTIEIDPRSRMHDPNDPDCPPMPPDDPASHQYMLCVDCKKGSPCWRCAARTPYVQNPNWFAYLPRDEEGEVVLDMLASVQMARLQSPDFQEALEELYLSALDVTFERFRFDTQFFGGTSVFFTADGRERSGLGAPVSRLDVNPLAQGNRLRAEKLTATGAELVVGLANSLVWQFSGPDNYAGFTLLDFSVVQPLLRAGGRTRVLERLTIAERSLLANVRQMERFRRGFYVEIATGRSAGAGPSRRGGFFGGAGLEGFSGVGGGGFGRVGGAGFGGVGGGVTGGAGAAAAGGFLGLLQNWKEIENQRANVAALRGSAEQLEASHEAGRIDRFQVDLARQALFNAQSQLLTREAAYEASLDDYKVELGLPPDLDVRIADPMLDRFSLLSPAVVELQGEVAEMLSTAREVPESNAAGAEGADAASESENQSSLKLAAIPMGRSTKSGSSVETAAIPTGRRGGGRGNARRAVGSRLDQTWDVSTASFQANAAQADDNAEELPPPAGLGERLDRVISQFASLHAGIEEQLAAISSDIERLDTALPERRTALRRLAARDEVTSGLVEASPFEVERLDERVVRLKDEFGLLKGRIDSTLNALTVLAGSPPADVQEKRDVTVDVLSDLSTGLGELVLVQALARLEAITLRPIELTPQQALEIARVNRRDWQNARANLVDSWRLIFFNANDLLSSLDITFSGDIANVGDNPFRLRDTAGRLRAGIEFDAPLTRIAERNVYRQSLIEYQQARRSYYRFVDRVNQGLRNTLRTVRLNELNFELRRQAVLVAIAQVDLTQLRLSRPPQPGETSQFGDTTARDLVQSLSDLLNVQNDFLSVWVNYEVQRMNLDFDLGTMQIGADGAWLDNGLDMFQSPSVESIERPEPAEADGVQPLNFGPEASTGLPAEPGQEIGFRPVPTTQAARADPENKTASPGDRG